MNKNAGSPLHRASLRGHNHISEFLIKKGLDVSLYNSKRYNPISGASENRQESAVQVVVENSANVNLFKEN